MSAEPSRRGPVLDLGQGVDFYGLGARVHRVVHPQTVGSRQVAVSIALMRPGDRVKRHRHSYEEAYYVVRGRGVMYLEGVGEIELTPGRSVYIASNLIHGQVNTSDAEDLEIVCSLSPPPPAGEVPELFE
jgi:quercetin dioxygenase-like cupin family protein